jgi:hypothetical protein
MDGGATEDFTRLFDGLLGPAPGSAAPARARPGASPYADLPPTRFWRTGVAESHPLTVQGLYAKRFDIGPEDRIATAGSCFAQHIATHLRARGFSVLDVEPTPRGLEAVAKDFGYGIYSARYGNLYTARQLLELFREAMAENPPPAIVWEKDGRFYDALRPGVEPRGLSCPEEVVEHRRIHLAAARRLFERAQVFVFTFGLTESWRDVATGRTLPTCPGTIAGTFDPAAHVFHNFTVAETLEDYRAFRAELAAINPGVRHLVTVSPVPLTATAADQHVLLATTYSKSALRAAAGQLAAECPDVDYFPSYEIITAPWSRGFFFEPNLRSVSPAGVEAVMRVFFAAHALAPKTAAPAGQAAGAKGKGKGAAARAQDAVCEEILLEAFAR